jgi:hypothetical protein
LNIEPPSTRTPQPSASSLRLRRRRWTRIEPHIALITRMRPLIASILALVSTLAFVAFAANTPYTRISEAVTASEIVARDVDLFANQDVVDVSPSTVMATSEASMIFAADMPGLSSGTSTSTSTSTFYKNHSGIEPPKTTSLSSTSSFAAPAVVACWSSDACTQVLCDLAAAYAVSGDITDPNERGSNGGTDQSRVFQARFCGNISYQKSVDHITLLLTSR